MTATPLETPVVEPVTLTSFDEIYKILDEMLTSTTERHLIPSGELQNWLLDMRSATKRAQESAL